MRSRVIPRVTPFHRLGTRSTVSYNAERQGPLSQCEGCGSPPPPIAAQGGATIGRPRQVRGVAGRAMRPETRGSVEDPCNYTAPSTCNEFLTGKDAPRPLHVSENISNVAWPGARGPTQGAHARPAPRSRGQHTPSPLTHAARSRSHRHPAQVVSIRCASERGQVHGHPPLQPAYLGT